MGASQAKFNIICFLHEDVLFRSQNWGLTLVSLFADHPDLGLVGLAGSKYKKPYIFPDGQPASKVWIV